jgi:hypothetical protein
MIDAVLACVIQCNTFYSDPATYGARTAACMAASDFDKGMVPQQTIDSISRAAQADWTRISAYEWEIIGREENKIKLVQEIIQPRS